MNTFIDDFGISSNDYPHYKTDRSMGRLETSSAPCYGSPDSPVVFHRFTDWETLGKMSEQPLSPRRRHRKAKLSLAHVRTMTFQPEAVFQFDVWSYFTLSHSEQASSQYQDPPHHRTGDEPAEVVMTSSQLADVLARSTLEDDDRLDSLSFAGENEHRPQMKQLCVEEMTDILRHINLCEQTKSAIQYDVIDRMIYPDLEVDQWQPLGSIALNSESCVSSVSWEESIGDSSSIDDEFEDESRRSSRSLDSEFQDL